MILGEDIIALFRLMASYFNQKGYRYALIGANVPLILIDWKESDNKGYGIRPTRDVDFSVEVEDWEDYQGLKKDLLGLGLVQKDRQPDHRFFMDDLIVDILPYGEAIVKDGIIEWPGTGDRMNVTGFDKLFKYVIQEPISEDLSIPVIPLSLLVFTKIIAYLDRRALKDLQDIMYVLEHYEEASVIERRYDVIDADKLIYETSGAYLLGQDLRELISKDEIEMIGEFFRMMEDEFSEIVQQASRKSGKKAKDVLDLFQAFKLGMEIENL